MKPSISTGIILAAIIILIANGCAQRPLRGGSARIGATPAAPPSPGFSVPGTRLRPLGDLEFSQPENPAQGAGQQRDFEQEKTLLIPTGSTVTQRTTTTDADGKTNVVETKVATSAPTELHERHIEHAAQNIGAAQKDTSRELAARFRAGLPLMILGLLFLLGGGALAYFQWWTKAVICWASGVACLSLYFMLPSISGVQWLLIILGTVIVGAVLLLIYYSYHKGQFDRNADGVPDFLQGKSTADDLRTLLADLKTARSAPAATPAPSPASTPPTAA